MAVAALLLWLCTAAIGSYLLVTAVHAGNTGPGPEESVPVPAEPCGAQPPAPLRKAEGELRRRLIVPDVVGRIACTGDRRGLGRQPQVREETPHRLTLRDHGEHTERAATLDARHHVHVERTS